MIEGLVSIDAMIPIVIFGFIGAISSLIAVHVEDDGVYGFQILF